MASCALTREEIIDLIKAYELHIVSAVTGGGTTTLTRNDGGTFEFPTAAVTETDDNYIIEVGDDNIVIPKCYNKLYDCNGDRIDTCSQKLVTCADLESRKFLTSVATDNSIFGNGTPSNPLGTNAGRVPYDDTDWFLDQNVNNVEEALDSLSDFLSTAFGEDLVILNNPTFYIRQSTGSSNPQINEQSDLTIANAFDSFNAMKSFIRRTYIVGKVTIDARGTFDLSDDNLLIRPEDFKNSTKIDVRGDPNDVEAFTIKSGFDTRTRRWSFRNCVSTIKDFTIEFGNVSQVDGGLVNGVEAADGSTVSILGAVKVKGLYDIDRSGSPSASIFRSKDGATMSLGIINERALKLIFSLNGASKFNQVFDASYGGKMSFLPLDVVVNNNFNANFLFSASSNGTMRFNGDYLAPIELTTFSGAGKIAVTNSANLNKQSYIEMFGVSTFYGGDGPNWINTAWPYDVAGKKIRIDKYSLFMNNYGTDLTSDTDFVVV